MSQEFSEEKVQQVFNSFCEDGSGLLNLEQIQKVNKENGIEITNYDMKKVFKKLDQDKDQKISFGEYYLWVYHGRQKKQEAILFTRNKFIKMINKAAKKIDQVKDLSLGDSEELSEHQINSNVGDAPPKSFFGVRTFVGSEALAFSKEHTEKFNDIKEGTPAIILKIATDQPDKAEEEFMTLFEELIALGESLLPEEHVPLLENIKIDYATQGSNHLLIGITIVHELFTEVLEKLENLVLQNIPENLVTSVKLQVSAGINLKDLVEDLEKSIQDSIGQTGLSISLDANIKQSILEKAATQAYEVLQKKEEKDGQNSDKLKMLQKFLPLFLIRGSKVNLNFKTLDKLFENSELPGQEMIEISGQELIDQIIEMAGGNVQEMIEELPVGESIIQVFQEYCKADAQLSIQIPRGVVQAYVSTEGIKQIVDKLLDP